MALITGISDQGAEQAAKELMDEAAVKYPLAQLRAILGELVDELVGKAVGLTITITISKAAK
jgi:hypothetical protein